MVHNDYYRSYYNNSPSQQIRLNLFDRWGVHFDKKAMDIRVPRSLKEEVLLNCELIYEKLDVNCVNVFLSGGMDSECVVRSFCEKSIPVCPVILVHTNGEQREETLNAFSICDELNLCPVIFKIDPEYLFSTGKLQEVGIRYQTPNLANIQLCYVAEILQAPVVVADEIRLINRNSKNKRVVAAETTENRWQIELKEEWFDGVYDRFSYLSGIPVVQYPLRYTPQSWAAMLLSPVIQNIVKNDCGKISALSSKNAMMSYEFGVKNRVKTGLAGMSEFLPLMNNLRRELFKYLLPFEVVEIEYNEMLGILGVVNGI